MNDTQKNKITRFLDDKVMSDSVYDVLLDSFLKKRAGDVHVQAASFIAVGLLQDAWRELEVFRIQKEESVKSSPQVGL